MPPPVQILIVEDDADTALATQRVMTRAGHESTIVGTGADALRSIQADPPDLVLLDRNLPDMDGLEVCRQIKSDPALAYVFVILVSASFNQESDQITGLETGADGYIPRPIGNQELSARVNSFVRIQRLNRELREQAKELKNANAFLTSSRLAAQNLMDDAVAARQKAEALNEELRQRETLLQKIFDLLPVGLWIADKNGKLQRGNPAGVKIWGAEPTVGPAEYGVFKARRLPSREEIAPDDWALAHTIRDRAVIENELLEIDAFDGVTRTILNFTAPVLDDQGQLQGAIIVNMDITGLKQVEEALRTSEAKSRSILDNIGIGVALISPDMEILELNHRMQTWFPDMEPGGQPLCFRTLDPPPNETASEGFPVAQTLQDGEVHEVEANVQTADGSRRFRIISSPVRDDQGRVIAAIELVEDITEKSALELQLQQARKMESVGRLAGGVAHDFNNMLGVILGHAEMALGKTPPAQPLHNHLAEIHKAAERSADLTRQLLAFARKQTVTPKVLDLNAAIEGMLNMLHRLLGENIRLDWSPGPDLWPLRMDPSQIDQILANLCVNARDAIHGDGRISIATDRITLEPDDCSAYPDRTPGDFVRLVVRDTGTGMDPETLSHIFEPFYTTKGLGQGTGLGLATVYGAVRQNGGFIQVESRPGEGTTFTLHLPRHRAPHASRSPSDRADDQPDRGHETILLVEDEPAILKITTAMLEQLGYRVLPSVSPGEALRIARDHAGTIDLLMTDVVMPEMNGRDLARNLLAIHPDIKRLFMSGYTDDVIAHHGVLEPGVQFIQKPFTIPDLGKAIRTALARDPT